MKRIIQITLLLMLINGTAFGQVKSDCEMNISIWGKNPEQYIKLSITSPEGTVIWKDDSKTNKVLDSYTHIIRITANNWYSLPGNYNIKIEFTDEDSENKKNYSLDFAMNGDEINVKTIVDIAFHVDYPKLPNAFFYIEKRYNSSDSVILIERWKPSPKGEPSYIIINNSTENIKGTAFENILYGYIMKYEDGKWNQYFRGIQGAQVIEGKCLSPGDSTIISEGSISGKPYIFTPGRYKYFVYYTHSSYDFDLFRSRVENNVVNIYLLEKEFIIE